MKSLYLLAVLIFASWSINSDATCTTKYKNNLRGAPSTSASIVSSLPMYSPLEVIDREGDWMRVKGLKLEGWIFHSLIDQNIECMSVRNSNNAFCTSKVKQQTRDILYSEGFKVIKKEIGCNLVLDKYGKKIWLNNTNIWPESSSMKIIIN